MYAIIFKAEINELDQTYIDTAQRLRELALRKYGCLDFISTSENNQEIAISYWPSKEHILKWKQNPEHLQAQALGKKQWYKSYHVQIVEVLHQYECDT